VKCKLFDQGYCRFASNCRFAHGEFELRNPHDPLLTGGGDEGTSEIGKVEGRLITLEDENGMSSSSTVTNVGAPTSMRGNQTANMVQLNAMLT